MLRVESVSYEIGKRYLLKDITFSIRKGEMVAILGANGAGKSTLMKILCREKEPSEGKVVYDGKNLNDYTLKELSERRATLYQQNFISLAFTVEEVVLMGRYGKGGKNTNLLNRIVLEETLEVCGINHLVERSMLTLSGGEQQRVHLARVLAQVWDNKDSLLLLDEPIANMDMLYQHQTLAIVKALAKKGYMVVCVLHEINMAAQYADRIIMLKGGRKWWDGAPEEVFTSRNIFTAFGLHTSVQTNPQTLFTQVTPKGIKFDAAVFNSNLGEEHGNLSLAERYLLYQAENPGNALWKAGEALGVSELDLVLLSLGKGVSLLQPDMENILRSIESIGYVRAVTYNTYCKTERCGVYRNFLKDGYTVLFLDLDIDLRIFINKLKYAVAVEEEGGKSIQFFDDSGWAIHKVYLTSSSNNEAYYAVLKRFLDCQQPIETLHLLPRKRVEVEGRDADVDISAFHKAWESMQDTHEFYGILKDFKMSRMQSLRLAPSHRAMQISMESFRRTMIHCSISEVPVMMFTANEGCIQVNSGKLSRIDKDASCLKISDALGGVVNLKEDAVHSVWHVIKPTKDGNVNSLELYDTEGQLIVQFFGCRKPGVLELNGWREAIGSNMI